MPFRFLMLTLDIYFLMSEKFVIVLYSKCDERLFFHQNVILTFGIETFFSVISGQCVCEV